MWKQYKRQQAELVRNWLDFSFAQCFLLAREVERRIRFQRNTSPTQIARASIWFAQVCVS